MPPVDMATADDLPAVRQLLERNQLPLDGIDHLVSAMLVARDGDQIVGCAALELYADGALLRSVAVHQRARGTGVGSSLTRSALLLARERGATTAFLLTTTAERFFPKFGFEPITRDDVPESVKASIEFRSACPASAVVMRTILSPAI